MRAATDVQRVAAQIDVFPPVAAGSVTLEDANLLLEAWGHYLGPVRRPFRSEAFALALEGEPVAVAVSASVVSATVAEYRRGEVVELARLCTRPGARWGTRVLLRLWREVFAPRWACWPVRAAVAYSQNARHEGNVYRFDGWTKVRDDCGSRGGGAWTRPRYATHAARGRKTLWVWRYGDPLPST